MLIRLVPSDVVPNKRGLRPTGLRPSRGIAPSGFRPLRQCHTAACGRHFVGG